VDPAEAYATNAAAYINVNFAPALIDAALDPDAFVASRCRASSEALLAECRYREPDAAWSFSREDMGLRMVDGLRTRKFRIWAHRNLG
jgi:hypothetical protein